MNTLCTACRNSPGGIDGHADLMVETMGDARMCFRCQACRSSWLRTPDRKGSFVWTETGKHAPGGYRDLLVPPLSAVRWGS